METRKRGRKEERRLSEEGSGKFFRHSGGLCLADTDNSLRKH
jgi:hypothetical protein